MSNSYFRFKRFTVQQDRCAMKVGTDGVLLGACTDIKDSRKIMDVGTGTGLVALMLAQRSREDTEITALEIDEAAAGQAAENVAASPWNSRIRVIHEDFKKFVTDPDFDLIVSNPPYFSSLQRCPDSRRSTARHTGSLDFGELIGKSTGLLNENGRLVLIFPTEAWTDIRMTAAAHGFCTRRLIRIFTRPDSPSRRMLADFSRETADCIEKELYVENGSHGYTEEFIALVKDFYLKF